MEANIVSFLYVGYMLAIILEPGAWVLLYVRCLESFGTTVDNPQVVFDRVSGDILCVECGRIHHPRKVPIYRPLLGRRSPVPNSPLVLEPLSYILIAADGLPKTPRSPDPLTRCTA
jgi:hypothetical protein